jgi:hypothetical protein
MNAAPSTQRSLFDARAERDLGLARIERKNLDWMTHAMQLLPQMRGYYDEVTGEEMRVWLLGQGLPPPSKPNAWGALTRTAITRGLLTDTGRVSNMRVKQSHARRTPVWRFTEATR